MIFCIVYFIAIINTKFLNSVTISPKHLQRSNLSVQSSTNTFSYESLPWKQSIDTSRTLSYMPMLESTLKTMNQYNFKRCKIDDKFHYQTSSLKPARISSMSFENEVFRKVRMTYFDAGESVQVFNALFYPHYQYDLPLLGNYN
jgi:hypothetical protein